MIFNLFKSKPTLKDLIPEGFVDIHSHVLPCVDDGAKNIKESVDLIEKMNEMGFAKIIATPHTYPGLYENNKKSILSSYNSIKNKLDKSINIDFASEYLIDINLINEKNIKELLCLKDKYLLLELSYLGAPLNLFEIIFQLIHKGYYPIIAHPERYRYLHNDFQNFIKLRRVGCKFQINLLSCIGYYGNDIMKFTDKLLEKNMVDFVGSDIHNKKHVDLFDKKIKVKNIAKLEQAIKNNEKFN